MPRYFIELTENERLFLIMACGAAHNIPGVVSSQGDPPAIGIEIARRLISVTPGAAASPAPIAAPQPQGTPPAAPAPRQEIPKGAIELSVTPVKIVKVGSGEKERLLVKWMSGSNECLANCWIDQKAIWPRVLERVKKPSMFYAKQSGIYLNIVGVK